MGVERGLDLGGIRQGGRRRFGLGQGACGRFLGIRGLTLRGDCSISFRLQRPHRLRHAEFAEQRHDSARALSRRHRAFHRGLQLGCPRLCVCQLLAQLADGIELRRRFVERLRRAVCVLLDHPHVERDLVLLLVSELHGTATHPLVDAEVEQLDEEVLPVGRLVVQELANSPWGRITHRVKWLNGRPMSSATAAFIPLASPASTSPPHSSRASFVVAPPSSCAARPAWRRTRIRSSSNRNDTLASLRALRDRGRDQPIVAEPRDRAVRARSTSRRARSTCRPGRTDEREEVDAGEVDRHRVAERGEPLSRERQRPHQVTSSSSSAKSGSAADPRRSRSRGTR